MTLTLKDSTSYVCADNSTVSEIIIFVTDIAGFVAVYNKMIDENLSEFSLGETTVRGRTLSETKTYKWADQLETHFVILPREAEARIEALEARVEEAEDKAQAYDILMGEEA